MNLHLTTCQLTQRNITNPALWLLFPSHCTLHIKSYLISSAIVAGELALPVDFLALLCVRVENDAIS